MAGTKAGKKDAAGAAREALQAFGLAYPGAHTKSPWPGHRDLAVNDKTFAYMSSEGEPFSISCKLPLSGDAALSLPFTTPTAYGLGKSGWVTATFPEAAAIPVEMLREWIDESYRAQAPKRLSAQVPALGDAREDAPPRVTASAGTTPSPRSTVKRAAPAKPRSTVAPEAQVRPARRGAGAVAKKAPKPAAKKRPRASG